MFNFQMEIKTKSCFRQIRQKKNSKLLCKSQVTTIHHRTEGKQALDLSY